MPADCIWGEYYAIIIVDTQSVIGYQKICCSGVMYEVGSAGFIVGVFSVEKGQVKCVLHRIQSLLFRHYAKLSVSLRGS